MMLENMLPFLMFASLLLFIMLGFPVAFTLAGTAILFGLVGYYLELFYLSDFGFIPARIFGIMQNITLMAVPLFIFMGIMLERSKLAADLLSSMSRLFRNLPGGLAIAVVLVGMLLAASTGIVGATVVTMGVLALPTMLKEKYDPRLATGCIAASGTLGQIIPPSIVLVILGDMMNVDVGDIFMGALIPGFLLVVFYIFYIAVQVYFRPTLAPAAQSVAPLEWKQLWQSLLPIGGLILIVLGSIFSGIASPTEAAACGALGALVIAWLKKRFNWQILQEVCQETAQLTAMVFIILVGAQFFGVVFRGLAGDEIITEFIQNMGIHKNYVLLFILLLLFILGFFLDFIEVCFIVVPIVAPLLIGMGFNPLWLAILFAVNLQTSFLTPPFGFALFYLKGVAPESIRTLDIYRGILPFVIIQIITLLIISYYPATVLWLPMIVFQ